jgi:hypothetical protein
MQLMPKAAAGSCYFRVNLKRKIHLMHTRRQCYWPQRWLQNNVHCQEAPAARHFTIARWGDFQISQILENLTNIKTQRRTKYLGNEEWCLSSTNVSKTIQWETQRRSYLYMDTQITFEIFSHEKQAPPLIIDCILRWLAIENTFFCTVIIQQGSCILFCAATTATTCSICSKSNAIY